MWADVTVQVVPYLKIHKEGAAVVILSYYENNDTVV
jgi:hypothetical protein